MNAQFFYGEPGGETKGPLPLETIQAAARSGRLGASTMVSRDGAEPWANLEDVSQFGLVLAFDHAKLGEVKSANVARNAAALRDAAPERIRENSVGGFLEVFGWLNIILACVCIFALLVMLGDGKPVFHLAAGAVSCLSVGILFLAAGELLMRLKEISTALHLKK